MSEDDRPKQEEIPEAASLLDVVEEAYPGKVGGLFGGLSRIGRLFTVEDWLNILIRSRSSFEQAREGTRKKEKK